MKFFFLILTVAAAFALPAAAQVAGVYYFGVTNAVPSNSTNNAPAYVGDPNRSDIIRCDEYDFGGLTVSFSTPTAAVGNVTLRLQHRKDTIVNPRAVAVPQLGSTVNSAEDSILTQVFGVPVL